LKPGAPGLLESLAESLVQEVRPQLGLVGVIRLQLLERVREEQELLQALDRGLSADREEFLVLLLGVPNDRGVQLAEKRLLTLDLALVLAGVQMVLGLGLGAQVDPLDLWQEDQFTQLQLLLQVFPIRVLIGVEIQVVELLIVLQIRQSQLVIQVV